MQKIHLILLSGALLVSSALSSCKKEEMKQTNTDTKSTDIQHLARNNNYVRTGIYYEGPGGMFSTCLYSGPCCMVVVRPVITFDDSYMQYAMTPEEGETVLQVDKYKESGIESRYYSRIEVTVDQNGQETYEYIP